MMQEMVNSGNFIPLRISFEPSISLFENRLVLSSQVTYIHEWHNGLYKFNNQYLFWTTNINSRITNHLSALVYYVVGTGKGYMRGSSYLSKSDPYSLYLKLQYTKGNLFVSTTASHILKRKGYYKQWLNSEYVEKIEMSQHPSRGLFFTLSLSYTINFGNRTSRQDNFRFSGETKTSAL